MNKQYTFLRQWIKWEQGLKYLLSQLSSGDRLMFNKDLVSLMVHSDTKNVLGRSLQTYYIGYFSCFRYNLWLRVFKGKMYTHIMMVYFSWFRSKMQQVITSPPPPAQASIYYKLLQKLILQHKYRHLGYKKQINDYMVRRKNN